jgi:RNA polymerase sigma-70 factor, ECF subfamily
MMFDVALRIVRDPGEAEDVVQTVFLDVFRAMANFDSRKGILKVWLLQYAYHRALHRKRHLVSNHFYRWENLEAAIELGSGREELGLEVETAEHPWVHWRSLYVTDPEGNQVELVCYDGSV